jgi:hypothetical protein
MNPKTARAMTLMDSDFPLEGKLAYCFIPVLSDSGFNSW